jgi:cell division protein FtsB
MTTSIYTRRQPAFIRWVSRFALFLMMFHSLSYAGENTLLNDQILHISCNGEATDQSDLKHPVENKGVTFFSDRLTQRRIACFFDGNDYLKIPNHPTFTMSRFTMSAWVRVEGSYNGTERRAIVSNYAGGGDAQHYGINMGSGVAGVFVDDGNALDGARDLDGFSLTDDKWHHVAAVFEQGAKTKLYVDGELRRQSSSLMPANITPTGDLYIGRSDTQNGFEKEWIGSIDEVRLFKRALSDDEIGLLSTIIDLSTGETFIPAGYGENDPYFLTVKEGPVDTFKMTPNLKQNQDGSFSIESISINNASSSDTRRIRNGSSTVPSKTSTLTIKDGEMTLIDEALPGIVATVNIFGDLIVTDTKYSDLKLILYRNDDQFVFQSESNPSINIKVHADGSLDIIDENHPNLKITRDKQSIIKFEDAETNTVTLVDMDGNATLTHQDAPNIEVKFNVFDTPLSYTLTDTVTGDCIEFTPNSDTRKSVRNGLINSVLKNLANSITGNLISAGVGKVKKLLGGSSGSRGGILKPINTLATGGAVSLGTTAKAALRGFGAWWACLPALSKFAIAGGAIGFVLNSNTTRRNVRFGPGAIAAGVAGVGVVAYLLWNNSKLKKKIKELEAQVRALRHQVQVLEATVAQQAEEIKALRETVKDQAEQIVILKNKINEQAKKIDEQAQRIATIEAEAQQRQEQLDKQAEMMESMKQKIADLEERTRKGNDGAEEIPPGEAPGTRRGLRNGSSDTCRTPITPAMCQVYGVQDQGPNDSIAFFYNPVEQTVTQIGDTCQGCDLEAMAIHPETNEIYLGSGDNAVGHPNGHLYQFDANSGALRSVGITGFEDISGLTFDDNGVLWGWAKGQGLVILDIDTGQAQIEFASSIELADLSWDSNYQLLYGVVGNELWSYDPTNGNANQLCGNLPRKTEAVKALPANVSPAGLIWIGSHNNQQTELQAYEIATCQPQKDLNLSIGYDDVEGLAMPTAACQ